MFARGRADDQWAAAGGRLVGGGRWAAGGRRPVGGWWAAAGGA
ncbi:hypothetical protein [Streptomyces europaeiscabiei]|nr:hypothetical protein [Streptomyces europaeiscabiei]MDX2526672.1 hypothetical protein [Streptomyces europaeiscabiei]